VLVLAAWGCGASPARPGPPAPAPPGAAPVSRAAVSPFAAQAFLEAELALLDGDPQAAVQALEMALSSAPDDALIRSRLAAAYLAQDRPEKAREVCETVLEDHPHHDLALVTLGDVELSEGSPGAAEELYVAALEAEPGYWPAMTRLVRLYRERGDLEAAMEIALMMIAADPTSHTAYHTAAELALEMNHMEEAYTFMAEYIRTLPVEESSEDRYSLLLGLAARLLSRGQAKRALFLHRTYLEMFPTDRGARLSLARNLVALGRTLEARKVLAGLGDPSPGDPASGVVTLADLWLQSGAPARSLLALDARFGDQIATSPPAARLVRVRALCALLLFDEAQATLDDFGGDEDVVFLLDARAALAASFMEAGLVERGWEVLADRPAEIPDLLLRRELRRALAEVLLGHGHPEIEAQIELACSTSVQGRAVVLEASMLGEGSPDGEELSREVEDLLDGDLPADVAADVMVLHAVCLAERTCEGDPAGILSIAGELADVAPNHPMLPAVRGMHHLVAGDPDRAVHDLDLAARLLPSGPLVKLWLARALSALGEQEHAREKLEDAMLLDPPPFVRFRTLELLAASG
jgi:tetratricopeptide (TPR) repeat protein